MFDPSTMDLFARCVEKSKELKEAFSADALKARFQEGRISDSSRKDGSLESHHNTQPEDVLIEHEGELRKHLPEEDREKPFVLCTGDEGELRNVFGKDGKVWRELDNNLGGSVVITSRDFNDFSLGEQRDVLVRLRQHDTKILPLFPRIEEVPELKSQLSDGRLKSSFVPRSGGEWEGEPGNSTWKSDRDTRPPNPRTNPEGKTWGDILRDYDIDGIPFENGEPDFSEVAAATIEIDDFSGSRFDNFAQADQALADKWNREGKPGGPWTREKVEQYRHDNGLSWHERRDMKTMDLVPTEIHGNTPHSGGISRKRSETAEA